MYIVNIVMPQSLSNNDIELLKIKWLQVSSWIHSSTFYEPILIKNLFIYHYKEYT